MIYKYNKYIKTKQICLVNNSIHSLLSRMDIKELKFRKKLGLKIQQIRLQRNLTQPDLAARIGYKDFQSIARIESGRVTTSIYTVYLISKGLECTVNDLLADI